MHRELLTIFFLIKLKKNKEKKKERYLLISNLNINIFKNLPTNSIIQDIVLQFVFIIVLVYSWWNWLTTINICSYKITLLYRRMWEFTWKIERVETNWENACFPLFSTIFIEDLTGFITQRCWDELRKLWTVCDDIIFFPEVRPRSTSNEIPWLPKLTVTMPVSISRLKL